MKMYRLIVWLDGQEKRELGIFSEDFCRRYCKQFAGKDNGFHVSCIEVK